MKQCDYLDLFSLAERLHRQFLDVIQLELDRLSIRDINGVRALMLLNIGDAEMTASELLSRGCYLGSNVFYNLKKLTETGYVIQERSKHDGRAIMVRNSEKGAALGRVLKDMNERHIAALSRGTGKEKDILHCRQMLRALHHFLSRAADAKPALSVVPGPTPDHAAAGGADSLTLIAAKVSRPRDAGRGRVFAAWADSPPVTVAAHSRVPTASGAL